MATVTSGYQAFFNEAPAVAQAFNALVQTEARESALGAKHSELAYLAVLAATRMTGGVAFHAAQARAAGATRAEVVSAILTGLPAVGLAVLDALPPALQAYDEA